MAFMRSGVRSSPGPPSFARLSASFGSVNQASLRRAKDAAPKRRSREGGQRIAHDSTPIACGNCQPFEVAAGLPPILKVHGQAFGLPSMSTMAGNKRFVYVVKNTDGIPNFYVGLSSDVKSRLADHNAGHCPHTASRRPARHLAARGFRVMLQMARNVLTCRCDQTSFAAA